MAIRNEYLFRFILACAGINLLIFVLLPGGATAGIGDALDPVQVQMLIDSYKDQLLFFKIAAGTVIGAQTSAIVWLAKRLLAELSRKKK